MKKNIAVVYLAAGISSRFSGKIKQLEKVGPKGETLIEYSIQQALKAGFNKIIFIVGEKTQAGMRGTFGKSYQGVPIFYAMQKYDPTERDKPWGTADALYAAKEFIDCPFVICNGDDIYGESSFKTLKEHLEFHSEEASLGYTLRQVLPASGTTNRGIFKVEGVYVKEIKEVLNISASDLSASGLSEDSLSSMNIFALNLSTLNILGERVRIFKEKNKGDRKIECYLPVEISELIKEGKIAMRLYRAKDQWLGITNPGDEVDVKKALLRNMKKN